VTVCNGPNRGSVFRLHEDGPHSIGRLNSKILISDSKVSRSHARLQCVDGQWFLQDLESRTGTMIDGELVKDPMALRDGSLVKIGESTLVVNIESNGTAPANAAAQSAAAPSEPLPTRLDPEHEGLLLAVLDRLPTEPAADPTAGLGERIDKLKGSNGHDGLLQTIAKKLESIDADAPNDRVIAELQALAEAQAEEKQLLPGILERLDELKASNGHEERLETAVNRLEAIDTDSAHSVVAEMRALAEAQTDAKQVLPQLLERLEELQNDQMLDGSLAALISADGPLATLIERVDALPAKLSDNDRADEILTVLRDLERQQKEDPIANTPFDRVLAEIRSLAEAQDEDKRLLPRILEKIEESQAQDDGPLTALIAGDGPLATPIERVEALPRQLSDDDRVDRILAILQDQTPIHEAGATTMRPSDDSGAHRSPAVKQSPDATQSGLALTAQAPQGEATTKLFAALRFLQLQQQRSNQILMRLAAIIDPGAEDSGIRRTAGLPPRPEFARGAAIAGAFILFLMLMCGLVIMVAGIAKQTSVLMD